eukprot:377919-Alexandrium_andersonii.AAC.1
MRRPATHATAATSPATHISQPYWLKRCCLTGVAMPPKTAEMERYEEELKKRLAAETAEQRRERR